MEKLLSIVLCGRNDNYLGDFKYRIQTAINYVGMNCARAGVKDDVEIIVVDWNSDEPLSQTLQLLPDTHEICRYIVVPPEFIRIHYPGGRRFHIEAAVNVGLRRANSHYAIMIPADILFTESTLANLVAVLKGKRKIIFDPRRTTICLDRKMLPWQIVDKQPTIDQWDRYIQLCGRHLFHDRYWIGVDGGYGGLLLHRDLWWECQGFDENNTGWGNSDLDWGLRMGQKYPRVSLEPLGIMLYDMDQRPEFAGQRQMGSMSYGNRIDLGSPNWGIGGVEFEQTMGIRSAEISFASELLVRSDQETALKLIRQAAEQIVPTLQGVETLPTGSIEHTLLAVLAWYCVTYWPARYFEFNCHAGLSTLAYAQLCSFGEIYAFDEYEEFERTNNTSNNILRYLDTLPQFHFYPIGFRGHTQLLTGNSMTVFDRLQSVFLGEMQFDIAVLRCDALKTSEQCLSMVDKLMNVLTHNGALFITAQSIDFFNSFHITIHQKYARHHFLHSPDQPFILLINSNAN
ncbi:hypothetical protein CCP3SC5AM1_700003 [Gammaproteobacteria bacterium]